MAIHDEHLLEYFRQKPECEMCGAPSPGRLDPHHVRRRGAGGGFRFDTPLNLVALCPGFYGGQCHEKHGNKPAMRETFERIIAKREGLEGPEVVRDAINRLEQRMVKEIRS